MNRTRNVSFLRYAVALSILCLLFAVGQAKAAVSVDSASSQGQFSSTGVLQMTWAHTVGTGSSRALYIGISTHSFVGALPVSRVTSITYGGQPLMAVGTIFSPDFVNAVEMFRMINPPSGTANIIVNFIVNLDYAVGGSVSFTGVNQVTPNGAFASSSGTNNMPTVTVGDSVAGDMVLDTLAAPPAALFFVPNASQTLQWNGRGFFSNAFDIGAGSTKPSSSPTTMSWITSNSSNWALGAVAVKAASATAASVTVSGRVLAGKSRGVAGATVYLTDSNGETRIVRTNGFGYYRFEDVAVGQNYTFTIFSKRYTFAPQVVAINGETGDLNFTAEN